ncbi:hypothetical protein LOZ12_000500 [Ophidiomyces ophidiicola]|uniref:Uncharacterized protein n=1 Tax=Ophidiomyces ophidiicola TaxID=1387563 RepID=A0ACB8V504_9EURO|nr:uncharacterized protein LOZ57_003396 [Ophidiomyces ophidiicola]KAI1926073.1 hypothetical protein LOZ64_000390 [Ophidiomyces ophidiicola]KAI1947158.1 hypothetical protein LOZ57_003396 [Ophidiomyces ophidiicola]KAI1955674.1 hypothetical protein LOZ62_000225 [Ophidiomyces ophidiicola]KAI1975970.1 hypothetical protein LOZ56_000287 [Ophidiomyces ophidiicola]KAI2011383.1 hypothetical protein LOZ50_000743 [Ophidiomyces ophidiicola]
MLGNVLRGHALVRNLRTCIRRSTFTPIASRPTTLLVKPIQFSVRTFYVSRSHQNHASEAARSIDGNDSPSALSENNEKLTKFSELSDHNLVSSKVIKAITGRMHLSDMTDIQAETIHHTLRKKDVLAQAKTGTGKTLAFLLPVIQNILKLDPSLEFPRDNRRRSRGTPGSILALIISPTRELAEQIAEEARKIVSLTSIQVQTAVGGTRKQEGLRRIQHEGCHLLVGTPGRLIDIFSDPRTGIAAPKLASLVLDEADRLLDDGFAPDIQELLRFLPNPAAVDRQTLLFSATMAPEVMHMVRSTMKPDFSFIKTVRDDEVPTHLRVPQKAVFLRGFENQMPAVMEIATQAIQEYDADRANTRPFKAIVYFNSTNEVTLAKSAFDSLQVTPGDMFSKHPLGLATMEMHSRLTQGQRTYNSKRFRLAQSAILFSSDVTARGMDFPDVTHVIQVGVARDRDSYIHRLGRTARANKTGKGWILATDTDYRDFNYRLRGLPIEEDNTLKTAVVDMSAKHEDLPTPVASIISQVKAAYSQVDYGLKEKCYGSFLSIMGSSREKLRLLNQMTSNLWGMASPPTVSPTFARKLGLNNQRGINIREQGAGEGFRTQRNADFEQPEGQFRRSSYRGQDSRFTGRRDFDSRGGRSYGRGHDRQFVGSRSRSRF